MELNPKRTKVEILLRKVTNTSWLSEYKKTSVKTPRSCTQYSFLIHLEGETEHPKTFHFYVCQLVAKYAEFLYEKLLWKLAWYPGFYQLDT